MIKDVLGTRSSINIKDKDSEASKEQLQSRKGQDKLLSGIWEEERMHRKTNDGTGVSQGLARYLA